MRTPNDVAVLKCRKICRTPETVRYLPHKNKISAPCQIVATARIVPKICQGQPQTFGSHNARFHPNRFTFGGVIVDRMKAVLWVHWVNTILARSDVSLPANNYCIRNNHKENR